MMKMLIELNDELIQDDGGNIKEMWTEIDEIFARADCTKNVIDNRTVMYESLPGKDTFIGDMFIISSGLYELPWFEDYANKLTVFENKGDDSVQLEEIDGLAIIKKYKHFS